MSRSYKKPFHSTTCIGSRAGVQKKWKRACDNHIRSVSADKEIPPNSKYKILSGDIWVSPNDGKVYNPNWKKAYRK